jgi:ribonuclease P protein component
VYRQGRSVSTRFLTLHWFPRPEDSDGETRLGLAVPRSVSASAVVRNRLKRQLRATWDELRDRTKPGCDYVLVPRQSLVEPAEARGHAWLVEQVAEVLGKASGA